MTKTQVRRMLKTQTYYEAVQVVERLEDGRLRAWWPGDKVETEREARTDAKDKAREFPGAEFEVIRVTIAERATFQKKPKEPK